MSNHRRNWTTTEKLEAIQILKKDGVIKASRQLSISVTTLYKWQNVYESLGEEGLSGKISQNKDTDLEKYRRENQELKLIVAEKELVIRMLNELIKKSTH
jgi:transposase-like protein